MQDHKPRTYSFGDDAKDEEAPPDEDIKVGLTHGKDSLRLRIGISEATGGKIDKGPKLVSAFQPSSKSPDKHEFNPFLSAEPTPAYLLHSGQGQGQGQGVEGLLTIDKPPNYDCDRKKYVGSPNFQLRAKPGKRVKYIAKGASIELDSISQEHLLAVKNSASGPGIDSMSLTHQRSYPGQDELYPSASEDKLEDSDTLDPAIPIMKTPTLRPNPPTVPAPHPLPH